LVELLLEELVLESKRKSSCENEVDEAKLGEKEENALSILSSEGKEGKKLL
jgi:hypothetical protein